MKLLTLLAVCRGLQHTTPYPNRLEQRRYKYDGWSLAYNYARGSTEIPAIILVHPVGIGLANWFWTPFIEALQREAGPEIFAPDLIGCGDKGWRPSERGLFLPLDYSRQLEELWRQEIQRPCVVIAQGGLAPVAVNFASRSVDLSAEIKFKFRYSAT